MNMILVKKADGTKQIHFVYCHERGYHAIYNFKQNKFIQQTDNNCHLIKLSASRFEDWPDGDIYWSPNMVYIKHLGKLMIFGATNHDYYNSMEYSAHGDIWSFDIENENAKWENLSDLKIPRWNTGYLPTAVVIGFDSVIYLFCVGEYIAEGTILRKVWCLDLYSMKWHESEKNFPGNILDEWFGINVLNTFIETNNGYVHHYFPGKGDWIAAFGSKYTCHHKICLYDVCPSKIKASHHQRYKTLVFGFVRREKKKFDLIVPDCLIKLCLIYFTIFV